MVIIMNLHKGNAAFLACFSLVAIAVTAMAFTRYQTSQSMNLTDSELKAAVIRLERTGCYGSCPAYKIIINGDGRVRYVGENNVKLKGEQQANIATADVKQILSEFDKANYFAIDQYSEKNCSCRFCTDMPTAITEIQVKGISHRVEHYYGCTCAPKPLWELEQAIDRIARTEQWTGDVSKQGPRGTTCFTR
jgi:hypothetical protein